MSGARSSSGLICSHGSDLDMRIPRAKVPKSALPQSLRRKLGFEKKRPLGQQKHSRYSEQTDPYAAGANVLKPRESQDGNYAAGCQKNFLKRGSGKAMTHRESRKAQQQMQQRRETYSKPTESICHTAYRSNKQVEPTRREISRENRDSRQQRAERNHFAKRQQKQRQQWH